MVKRKALDEVMRIKSGAHVFNIRVKNLDRPCLLRERLMKLQESMRGGIHRLKRRCTAFSGNQYVDLFVVREGKILEMDVWNDSAEHVLIMRGIEA